MVYLTAASKMMVDSRDHDGEQADRQQRSLGKRGKSDSFSPSFQKFAFPGSEVILPRLEMISHLGW